MTAAIRRLGKGLLYVYVTYLLLCLLVILPALNILAPRIVRDATGRELRSELLLFNPFTLAVEARGVAVVEADSHQPLAFSRLLVDLSLASLWQPGVVLDRFWLDDVDLHVLRYENGDFHFTDLIAGGEDEDEDAPEDEAPADLPAATVQDLRISAHTLAFTDRSRPGTYRTVQTDLGIHSSNLTTVPGRRGDGRLDLTGDGGGRIAWEGALQIADGSSSGRLDLHNIDLTHVWRYQAEELAFVADSARLDLRFDYSVDWQGDVDLKLSEGRFALRDIDLNAADRERYPDTHARLDELTLEPWELDLLGQRATAGSLALRGFELSGFDEGDTISLVDIFVPPDDDSIAAALEGEVEATVDGAADADGDGASAWQISLASFSLDDSGISWRTPHLKPGQMRVHPLRIEASDLSWPATAASPFNLELSINDTTRIATDGEVNIGSGAGRSNITLENFELPWLDPLVQEQLRTDLSRGRLSVKTQLELAGFAPSSAAFDITLEDFATVLHETGDEAFSLVRLMIAQGALDLEGQSVRIGEISLQQPAGSLYIQENGKINVNGVVRSGPEKGEETAGDTTTTDTASDGADAEADAQETAEAPWRVIVDRILLAGGRLEFADDSLPLPFRATIEDIEAEVEDVDTAAQSPLKVTLNGNVDGYAPVIIEGSGTPHGETRDGEVRFRFRGVDIATMSPYSGTYAGYTIDSGTLSLDLRYALDGQQIAGDNRIVISQMELGEPVSSELAVKVPLKLGLALLTDAKGVIDLKVPVSGNVDDPKFSIGQVIGRALLNVVTKAVTAPFKLLAGLVGSDADLENIDFAAGSTELTAEGDEALMALANALQQRPQLSLRIEGYVDRSTDGPVLRAARLEENLLAAGLPAASLSARDAAWEAAVTERFAALPAADTAVPSRSDSAEGDASAPSVDEMWQALTDSVVLKAGAFEALGSARAAAAKRELVTLGGVDAARIAISYDADGDRSAVHMTLDG